jgi:hypothetical protein
MAPREEWRFTPAVTADRADRLRSWVSFDEIAGALLQASVGRFWWEPFNAARLKGCNRASFLLHVAPSVYDAFFNSAKGYRAQYAISPSAGAAANRSLLNALEPMLVTAASGQSRASLELVRASLRGVDAKVWILEADVEEQLSDPIAALAYAPWEFDSPNGQGLRAPVGTVIEVKGAWLDPAGVERRDPTKENRGTQINKNGFI